MFGPSSEPSESSVPRWMQRSWSATTLPPDGNSTISSSRRSPQHIRNREVTRLALVVFNGTVMRDQPAHANLAGATFLEDVRTAPVYRLWTIGDRHPAMMRADKGGAE